MWIQNLDQLFGLIAVKDLVQGIILLLVGLPLGRWYLLRVAQKEFGLKKVKKDGAKKGKKGKGHSDDA